MRTQWSFIVLATVSLLMFTRQNANAGELLDRMIATVNGHVLLLSDWEDELRFECFTSNRSLAEISPSEKKAALDRLIEQELLREQARTTETKSVSGEQVRKQVDALKRNYLRENPGKTWDAALSKYGLTQKSIESHVTTELEQLQLIDTRFRPSIQISQAEIEQYYKNELVPKLPASDPVTLPDATPKIRELLVQNRMNEMLNSWLEMLRSQAQIRIVGPVSDSSLSSSHAGAQ